MPLLAPFPPPTYHFDDVIVWQLDPTSYLKGATGLRFGPFTDLSGNPATITQGGQPVEVVTVDSTGHLRFTADVVAVTDGRTTLYSAAWGHGSTDPGDALARANEAQADAADAGQDATTARADATAALALAGSPTSTFDVRAYGAIGDGVADDTLALQAVLRDVAGTNGQVVFAPGHTYRTTGELNVYGGTTLLLRGATIRREHNGYLLLVGDRGASYKGYTGNQNIHVRGGVLDSNGQNYPSTASTWCMSHVQNISFVGVTFRNGANSHFIECNAARKVRVLFCRFEGFNDVAQANYVESVQLDLAAYGGFPAYGLRDGTACDDVEVAWCTWGPSDALPAPCRGVGGHGGRVNGQHRNIRVHDNEMVGLSSYAVRPYNWTGYQITNNRIDGAGGIWVSSLVVGDGTTGNTQDIYDVQTGHSQDMVSALIKGNIIHATATMVGIYLDGQDTGKIVDHVVEDNIIAAEQSYAISLNDATNCTVRGNTARKGSYAAAFRNDAVCAGTVHYGNDWRGFGSTGVEDIGTGSITTTGDLT